MFGGIRVGRACKTKKNKTKKGSTFSGRAKKKILNIHEFVNTLFFFRARDSAERKENVTCHTMIYGDGARQTVITIKPDGEKTPIAVSESG